MSEADDRDGSADGGGEGAGSDPGGAGAGGAGAAEGTGEVYPIETGWVRESLRIPEVEGLEAEPGASEAEVEAFRGRLRAAAEAIAETAAATREEIRQRAWYYGLGSLSSAVIGILAFTAAAALPVLQLPGVTLAILELVAVVVFRNLQKRLARDLLAVAEFEDRYREPIEEARTPEDLARLARRIREEMAVATGPGK